MENPFAGLDITLPEAYRGQVEQYVMKKDGKRAKPVHQPFARNVDLWFFALCLAVRKGLKPAEPDGARYKAMEGVVLGSDSWRVTSIVLLALAETADPSVTTRPGEMLKLANGFAVAGLGLLFELMSERGGDDALDFLTEFVAGQV